MYADGLILLAISLNDVQDMINACSEKFVKLDMERNAKKSGCMRHIGKRLDSKVRYILVIFYLSKQRFLGVKKCRI